MKTKLILILSIGLAFGCTDDNQSIEGNVEMFEISSYEYLESGSMLIDKSTVSLEEVPLITYNEILSYTPNEFQYVLSDDAVNRLANDQSLISETVAFAMVANEEVVYTGYFWPATRSLSCEDCVVINPLEFGNGETFRVRLGYPEGLISNLVSDRRNHNQILEILGRDGKLTR